MRQIQRFLQIETRGQGLTEFTQDVAAAVRDFATSTGMAQLYCRHTSCSLLIQENADRDVQRDLLAFFRRLVPDGDPLFIHTSEGPDDMPAHIKAALTQTALAIPIVEWKLALGAWQGVFLFEHRTAPHRREIILHLTGD